MVKVYSSNSVFTVSVPALLAPALAGSVTVTVSAMASSLPVLIRANKEWKVEVPKEYQSWLKAEALSETELKVTTTTTNNLMVNRFPHPQHSYLLLLLSRKQYLD